MRKPSSRKNPRGRPVKGSQGKKSTTITTRATPTLRSALEEAARENKHSVSREIELRLAASFSTKHNFDTVLGSKENFAVAQLMFRILPAIEWTTGQSWQDDAYTFDEWKRGIDFLLARLRPKGEAVLPDTMDPHWRDTFEGVRQSLGLSSVLGLITSVYIAADEVPVPRKNPDGGTVHYSEQLKDEPKIKRDLGDKLLGRLKIAAVGSGTGKKEATS